jgi:hypothetical protein
MTPTPEDITRMHVEMDDDNHDLIARPCQPTAPTPGAGGAGDVGNRVDLEVIRERWRQHAEADGCAVHPAVLLLYIPELIAKVDRLVAERDALRAAVEKIPDIIRKSGEPGPGGVDITRGIPSVVYVGIGRERYEDGFELARETAEYTRDQAAGAVEVFIRAALARGPAAETKPCE